MDESRKQFLEWFSEEFESINNSEELHVQVIKMIAWQSWVKSRSAIELEMPEPFKLAKSSSTLTYYYQDEVDAVLSCAGIKVKE